MQRYNYISTSLVRNIRAISHMVIFATEMYVLPNCMTYGKRKAMTGVCFVIFLFIYFADNTEENKQRPQFTIITAFQDTKRLSHSQGC